MGTKILYMMSHYCVTAIKVYISTLDHTHIINFYTFTVCLSFTSTFTKQCHLMIVTVNIKTTIVSMGSGSSHTTIFGYSVNVIVASKMIIITATLKRSGEKQNLLTEHGTVFSSYML